MFQHILCRLERCYNTLLQLHMHAMQIVNTFVLLVQAPHSGMVTRHNSLQKITDELTTRDSNLSTYPEDSKISSGKSIRKRLLSCMHLEDYLKYCCCNGVKAATNLFLRTILQEHNRPTPGEVSLL